MEQQDSIGIKTLCGIFGWYAFKNALPVDTANAVLEKMAEITRHRGPDDWGSTLQGQAALGMTRLSIIDVTGGHQPLSSMDDKTHLVCNGEIYNFKGLRETLISHGAQFKTGSDSEVVLHAFRE